MWILVTSRKFLLRTLSVLWLLSVGISAFAVGDPATAPWAKPLFILWGSGHAVAALWAWRAAGTLKVKVSNEN